jgi:predicted nicotinamide N-methyase
MTAAPPTGWVEQIVALDGLDVAIHLPPDPFAEDLIDMEVYEKDGELPYWAELWPSAIALSRVLRRRSLHGRKVLELGCGMALPSIVAACGGARVLATDLQPDAMDAARHNAGVNGAEIETMTLDWRAPQPAVERGPWDLVIAADVLYEAHQVQTLLEVLVLLGTPVLLGDQGRTPGLPFFDQAAEHFDVVATVDPEMSHVYVYEMTPRA